jgi:hypothetical protein
VEKVVLIPVLGQIYKYIYKFSMKISSKLRNLRYYFYAQVEVPLPISIIFKFSAIFRHNKLLLE